MIMMLLSVTVGLALIAGATWAWFTDEDDAGDATFTAGILRIDVSDGLDLLYELESRIGNMNPGDLYEPIELIITNTGTKKLIWFGNWEITGGQKLREAIYINFAQMEFLSPDNLPNWEPTDNFIADGVGAGPYPGWYNFLASNNKFGVVGLDIWDDNNGMGTTPYEHVGALLPGYSYKLTVQFGFHKDAGNEYQGDVTSPVTVGFRVIATQAVAEAIEAIHPTLGAGGAYWANWAADQFVKQEAVR